MAYDLTEAAARAGIGAEELQRLVELGVVAPDGEGEFSVGHIRRVGEIGPVELKGVSGAVLLHEAHLPR